MTVLVADQVAKTYRSIGGDRRALDTVSLELRAGETLAVVGESGAGKTTLIKLLAGLEAPSEGSITLDGASIKPSRRRPSPIQMVFQNPLEALSPYWSIRRSVGEPLRSMKRSERAERVTTLLETLGIDRANHERRPATFSGGQLQRVVLARALAPGPKVLLCDEPTSALDVSVQAQIINLILELQQRDEFACLLVTHDLTVARVLADRILVLKDGAVDHAGPASEFFEEPPTDYTRLLLAAAGG